MHCTKLWSKVYVEQCLETLVYFMTRLTLRCRVTTNKHHRWDLNTLLLWLYWMGMYFVHEMNSLDAYTLHIVREQDLVVAKHDRKSTRVLLHTCYTALNVMCAYTAHLLLASISWNLSSNSNVIVKFKLSCTVHTHMHAHTHTCTHTHTHTHTHTRTYTHTYMHTHKYIHKHLHSHKQMHAHTYIHTYTQEHTQPCTFPQVHVHTCIHMCEWACENWPCECKLHQVIFLLISSVQNVVCHFHKLHKKAHYILQ